MFRYCSVIYCTVVALSCVLAPAQSRSVFTTPVPTALPPFLDGLISANPGVAGATSLSLHATVNWTSGNLHESGQATLAVHSDGSASAQFDLNKLARTEAQSAIGDNRTCYWTGADQQVHEVVGPDCLAVLPWFAPMLLLKPSSAMATTVGVVDGGLVKRGDAQRELLSYSPSVRAQDQSFADRLTKAAKIDVLFDPQTHLPASLEYSVHSDRDMGRAYKVRVTYGDYRVISGMPVPFTIQRYLNGSLQVSLQVSDAQVN